jgi:3-hydroxy-9,10-secoandrosta-1,3,5(10)-triene-9,17-dione monooxygenase reductase component
MDKQQLAPAIGKIPSGIYIATGSHDGVPVGMLCSFVEQAGFDPPMVTIAIQPGRLLHAAIEINGLFGLNILGEDDQALMKPFTQGDNPQPFDDLSLIDNGHNLPQLADALAFLACKIRGSLRCGGDHIIYLAEVIDGELLREDDKPMVRVRRNGFSY